MYIYTWGNGSPLQVLAWKIPWTEEPEGLQFMGSQWVGHDWVSRRACTHTHILFLILIWLTLGGWIRLPALCSRLLLSTHSGCHSLHPPTPVHCPRAHQPPCLFPQAGGIQPLTCHGSGNRPTRLRWGPRDQAEITEAGNKTFILVTVIFLLFLITEPCGKCYRYSDKGMLNPSRMNWTKLQEVWHDIWAATARKLEAPYLVTLDTRGQGKDEWGSVCYFPFCKKVWYQFSISQHKLQD